MAPSRPAALGPQQPPGGACRVSQPGGKGSGLPLVDPTPFPWERPASPPQRTSAQAGLPWPRDHFSINLSIHEIAFGLRAHTQAGGVRPSTQCHSGIRAPSVGLVWSSLKYRTCLLVGGNLQVKQNQVPLCRQAVERPAEGLRVGAPLPLFCSL